MIRDDVRSAPVRRMVVMGESNAYGMCATDPSCEWVQMLAALIRTHQDGPLRVFNNAIPANKISPDAPGYNADDLNGSAPSAIERYESDMIAYRPDLAVFAYGLNDADCGHEVPSFLAAYEEVIRGTRDALPDALIVMAGPYWNLQHDWERFQALVETTKWRRGGDDTVTAYNAELPKLAARYGAIYVDLYRLLEGATWLLHADTVHFNDVGQAIIGMTVFAEIAARCSFLALKSAEAERQLRSSVFTTGGTETMNSTRTRWRVIHPDDLVRSADG